MIKIGVLISGSGSNLQAIIDACKNKKINAEVAVVISNKKDAYGLERARKSNIPAVFIEPKVEDFNKKAIEVLEKSKVDLICLAGFLLKISEEFTRKYKNKILNIHPALLPNYGGYGMYGINVHKAVIQAKEKVSGCTVHFVDEEYDNGKIVLQKKVEVLENDTPEILQKRVLEQEHIAYPEALKIVIKMIFEKTKNH
ncbi:MAG: phosphoribosylglycinamide formyltransferase [Elusimicrobia bacterium RIFOXYD2_FULL_34_15]|nr:MAG: phosphoribosylglycinamide formyltransferase [Elusimicrobia bacterium RIFOXYD2_FULL_34_15]